MALTRVQFSIANTNAGTFTMGAAPTSGNHLIACVATSGPGSSSAVLTQTGVTWTLVVGVGSTPNIMEIFLGVVGSGASASVAVANGAGRQMTGIAEYSGLSASPTDTWNSSLDILDATSPATSDSNSATNSQADTLWITALGGSAVAGATSGGPTNGFTDLGAGHSGGGAGAGTVLIVGENIVSSIASTSSQHDYTYTGASASRGCIAGFKIAAASTFAAHQMMFARR